MHILHAYPHHWTQGGDLENLTRELEQDVLSRCSSGVAEIPESGVAQAPSR